MLVEVGMKLSLVVRFPCTGRLQASVQAAGYVLIGPDLSRADVEAMALLVWNVEVEIDDDPESDAYIANPSVAPATTTAATSTATIVPIAVRRDLMALCDKHSFRLIVLSE
jgi:hypothetical protein